MVIFTKDKLKTLMLRTLFGGFTIFLYFGLTPSEAATDSIQELVHGFEERQFRDRDRAGAALGLRVRGEIETSIVVKVDSKEIVGTLGRCDAMFINSITVDYYAGEERQLVDDYCRCVNDRLLLEGLGGTAYLNRNDCLCRGVWATGSLLEKTLCLQVDQGDVRQR